MEATEGFEPSNSDFADRRLRPLGYVAIIIILAGTTGLEPAATGVTDRHDNQLHHVPTLITQLIIS